MTATEAAAAADRTAPARRQRQEVDTVVGTRVVRFDRAERWLHWTNATLVLLLIVTGSLLYIGALGGLVGRRGMVRTVHLWAGIVVPFPFLLTVIGRWGSGFRRDAKRLGRFLTVDWRWLRKRDRRFGDLRIGKFNGGQKLNAVLVAGSLPVLFATGLLLHFSRSLPDSMRTGATFVHDWGYLGLTLLVAGHIVKSLSEPVSLHAMRTGLVPRRWVHEEHARWHDELPPQPADDPAGGDDLGTPYDDRRSDQP